MAHTPRIFPRQLPNDTPTSRVKAAFEQVNRRLEELEHATLASDQVGLTLNAASARHVDIVVLSDSNALSNGLGWDHGFQYAMGLRAQMYATGLISVNENNKNGSGAGFGYARVGGIGASTGAPAELGVFLDKGDGDLFPFDYAFLADGNTHPANTANGLFLDANCLLDVNGALDFDFHHGTFTTGTGAFRPGVRRGSSPNTVLQMGTLTASNTGAFAMVRSTVSIPAATRDYPVEGKFSLGGQTDITGPFFATYFRAFNRGRGAGFSLHTLYGKSSSSARDIAFALQEASDETLTHFFGEVRRGQQQPEKRVVVLINSGLNDRNEESVSVGTGAVADADSPEAYADNLQAIITRIVAIWTLNTWSASELFFLLVPSHPISNPDDAELLSYRVAAAGVQLSNPRVTLVDLASLTTYEEAQANSWYISSSDPVHLSRAGYEALAVRVLDYLGA